MQNSPLPRTPALPPLPSKGILSSLANSKTFCVNRLDGRESTILTRWAKCVSPSDPMKAVGGTIVQWGWKDRLEKLKRRLRLAL